MRYGATSTVDVVKDNATSPAAMRCDDTYAAEVMKNTTSAADVLMDEITSAADA